LVTSALSVLDRRRLHLRVKVPFSGRLGSLSVRHLKRLERKDAVVNLIIRSLAEAFQPRDLDVHDTCDCLRRATGRLRNSPPKLRLSVEGHVARRKYAVTEQVRNSDPTSPVK
jgi:hypothetical protein